VWAPLGPERLAAFVDAYRRFDPGVEHELLVLWNGFAPGTDVSPWWASLDGLGHEELWLERPVQDLTAYFEAVARHRADRYCFVNSYAEPLVDGWLRKLDGALSLPGVGIAGATGSWASTRSLKLHLLHIPTAYRGALPPPALAKRQFNRLQRDLGDRPDRHGLIAAARARVDELYEIPERIRASDPFPAQHVRTNVFILSRSEIERLALDAVSDKLQAYLLESGPHSITRQVERADMRAVVVDRDGAVFDNVDWPQSFTFWQGEQQGLLVADNQTRCYAEADAERRRLLSAFAWGRFASPTLS
jgi:hypothetical protein